MLHRRPEAVNSINIDENANQDQVEIDLGEREVEVEKKSTARPNETCDGWKKSMGTVEQNFDMYQLESDSHNTPGSLKQQPFLKFGALSPNSPNANSPGNLHSSAALDPALDI
jgi:hypothetical protein